MRARRHLVPSQTTRGTRGVPPGRTMVGLRRSHREQKLEGWGTQDSSKYIWGQLDKALNYAGSGVLVAIHHSPAQMLKIGQMNHALKVPVSADYKGSLGWPALLEMSALWIYEVRWEKSHISHCFLSASYLEQSLFKIKGCPRLQGYLILYWAA